MASSDSRLGGRIIFAVGARRSGTNWLARILSARPDVMGMPSETYLFSRGIAPLAKLFQHATPGLPKTAVTYMSRDAFREAARAFVDRVFEENLVVANAPDAGYLVERTPWHVYNLDLIAEVYPEAPIVHIIRDGRDVARSLLSKDWGPATMELAAEEWRSSVTAGQAAGESLPNYVEVFYEELLADPEAGIRSLYDRLALDPSPEALERAVVESRSAFNVDPAFPWIGSGKWRTAIAPADLRAFDRIAGPLLEELGYDRESPPPGGTRERLPRLALAVRDQARALGRPRQAIAALAERRLAQRSGGLLERNAALLQRLQDELARGHYAVLDELLTPTASIRVVDDGDAWDGRGPVGSARLRTTLHGHYERGALPLTGYVHPGRDTLTVVGTYRLKDGSAWSRTLVVNVEGGRIGGLALHRHPLPTGGVAAERTGHHM